MSASRALHVSVFNSRSNLLLVHPRFPLIRWLSTTPKQHQASVATQVRVDRNESNANQTVAAMGRTTSGHALKIRSYPTFSSLEDERLYRKQHLAAAYRIFAHRGFDEGVAGHISVRDPILTDHFCTSVA
jgi:hypothetical protein